MKKYPDDQSSYYNFLQKVSKSPAEEIENVVLKILGDFPQLLFDLLSPVGIYILDYKHQAYPYVSRSVEAVLGYKPEDLYKGGINFIRSKIHPDDLVVITNQVTKILLEKVNTLNVDALSRYRFSYNYRFKRGDGQYIHLLQQFSIAYVDENRNPLLYLGICSDISFLKKDNSIVFQISKYDGRSGCFKEMEVLLNTSNNPLTIRQVQVLRGIANQKTNKEIAESYDISEYTVRAHRRNILTATNCKKMNSAIAHAQRNGWI